ncbi:MAG: hypothetical protein HUJ75_07480 [Parasporobacterium sp.]|nr:hypothetical protein [Parasporobacterium sp.]
MKQIIIIDEDNTSLSPVGAALLSVKLKEAGITDTEVTSAGTVVLFPEPVNPKTAQVAERYGLDLSGHSARALSDDDLKDDVLVLALDLTAKNKVFTRFTGTPNVYTLKEYIGDSGNITPPLGGSVEDYEAVCENMSRCLDAAVKKLAGLE